MESNIISIPSLKDPASVIYIFRQNHQEVEVKISKQERRILQADALLQEEEIDHIIDKYIKSKKYESKASTL